MGETIKSQDKDGNWIPATTEGEKDWPGARSQELGVPLGEIGCPNCGSVCNGAIEPICPMCDKPYWAIEILKELIQELKDE